MLAACTRQVTPVDEVNHFAMSDGGVIVTPMGGAAKKVQLTILSPKVVRVTAFPTDSVKLPPSLMAVAKPQAKAAFFAMEKDGVVSVKTTDVVAQVAVDSGKVTFTDAQGKAVLSELVNGRTFTPVEVQGDAVYCIRQQFESPADEAFY